MPRVDWLNFPVHPTSGRPIAGLTYPGVAKSRSFDVYARNNSSAREAVSTIVHESSHVDRAIRRGIAPGATRYEEYLAFRREALFDLGRRLADDSRASGDSGYGGSGILVLAREVNMAAEERTIGPQDSFPDLLALRERGVKLLCPVCGAEVIAAFDPHEAKKIGALPGFSCSVDRNHYMLVVETGEGREAFRKLFPMREG